MSSAIVVDGSISPTGHPLVASYSVTAPSGATVDVEFGPDTSYGRRTSSQPAPPGGGRTAVLVAGMRAASAYHMRARIVLADGSVVWDRDQVFQTGPLPSGIMPMVTTQTFSPAVSPGVELINIITPSFVSVAVDLSGEIIWYYHDPADDAWQGYAFPIRPLPNGHMLASVTNIYNTQPNAAPTSAALPNTALPNPDPPAPPPILPAPWSVLREVDLAGQTVVNASGPRSLTIAQLNARLETVPTARGTIVTASFFEHDVLPLSNGHVILLVRH